VFLPPPHFTTTFLAGRYFIALEKSAASRGALTPSAACKRTAFKGHSFSLAIQHKRPPALAAEEWFVHFAAGEQMPSRSRQNGHDDSR